MCESVEVLSGEHEILSKAKKNAEILLFDFEEVKLYLQLITFKTISRLTVSRENTFFLKRCSSSI